MELGKTHKWFYLLLALAVAFIFILGAWWLYLVFKLASELNQIDSELIPKNLALMVQWEGLSFFALTLALGFALARVFWLDHQKTKSLQNFYATLTHELKTPLASMRLQAQVLGELVAELEIASEQKQRVERYSARLESDVIRLETELDKHLQLSRVERGGTLNLEPLSVVPLIKNEAKKFEGLSVEIDSQAQTPSIWGDQSALELIFRNLFQNTERHFKGPVKKAHIKITQEGEFVRIHYDDHGMAFSGDKKQLGKLFFKHDSPKGSGIGLYLIKKLCRAQGAQFRIHSRDRLSFSFVFQRGDSDDV